MKRSSDDRLMPKSIRPSSKVVFFFPSFASSEATAPLGVLAVATPLIRAGYQITLVDSTITPDYKKRVLEEVRDAVCLGISLVTGPMIRETVEIARAVKEWNPDFPIILGGWHPSLLPGQTLQADCVDYIVRGQGEDALLELVQHLETRAAPDLIPGIGFKRGGKLILTPERPLKPLVDMPPKAYHIADFDAYERGWG
jgi:anaerobic magnesium-protoporphyrin IX monomethyl ester cyclase